MCLVTYQERSTEVKEDMLVYKVMCVHDDGIWNSPYQGMEYIRDTEFIERGFDRGTECRWSNAYRRFIYIVSKGLHAYTSPKDANDTCQCLNKSLSRNAAYIYRVVQCRVPAKARQFVSINGREICVNKLTPLYIV